MIQHHNGDICDELTTIKDRPLFAPYQPNRNGASPAFMPLSATWIMLQQAQRWHVFQLLMKSLINRHMEPTVENDATLDEMVQALAPRLALHAAFDGWNAHAVAAAAHDCGIETDIAQLALEGKAIDLVDRWIESVDREMARRCPADALAQLKIRDRITRLVETRLHIMAPAKEALHRALSIMAMPQNLRRTAKIGWRTADKIWRLAGDKSADYNHYTKRAMLASVYASTVLVFANDQSEEMVESREFLARRIENIMQFEKAKAGFLARSENRPSLSRFLGRLRYPAR